MTKTKPSTKPKQKRGAERIHPTLRKVREGWGTRAFAALHHVSKARHGAPGLVVGRENRQRQLPLPSGGICVRGGVAVKIGFGYGS